MALNEFEIDIERKTMNLRQAADVVRFSFIVNNSVSYLDLSISENVRNRCIVSEIGYCLDMFQYILKHSIEFIGTQEKCRKIFAPERIILYTHHLDISKRREKNLKEFSDPYMESWFPFLTNLEISGLFYTNTLAEIIQGALQASVEKLVLLRLILKIPLLKKTIFKRRMPNIVDSFIDCFYPKILDCELFEEFIKNFRVADWILNNESKEIADFLLYNMRNVGNNLDHFFLTIPEITYYCILHKYFLNIGPILNYIDTPGVSEYFYSYIKKIPTLGPDETDEMIHKSEKWMNRERTDLVLIALYVFDKRNETPQRHEDALEALRLLWSCSKEAYMTFKDVERAFGGTHTYEELTHMYQFYCRSIGEDHFYIEPRPLTHFCRATIRKSLYKNKIWIPKGVALLPLPEPLKSFLNLKKNKKTEFLGKKRKRISSTSKDLM